MPSKPLAETSKERKKKQNTTKPVINAQEEINNCLHVIAQKCND